MKRKSIYKKALVLLAVLALTLVLLVGCGQTKKVDNLNQFVKPDNGNNGGQTETGVKTSLSGAVAGQLLFDSIINAKTVEPDNRYITFSLAPFFYIEKNGKTQKYTLSMKGSVDTVGTGADNRTVVSFEVLREADDNEITVLGIYALGDSVYIDFNDYSTGKAVHRYYVDDADIAYLAGILDKILEQLDIEGFLNDFNLGEAIGGGTVANILDKLNLKTDSLVNLFFSLIADNGCYSVTKPDGVVELVMPTKLNALLSSPALMKTVGDIVNGLLEKQSDIVKGIVNFLVGDILSGARTVETSFVAEIQNDSFRKLALKIDTEKGNSEKNYQIGVGELAKDDDFANKVKESMPAIVKEDRKDYSFTTLSADIDIALNLEKQQYSLENIDGALGGAIANLLGSVDGKVWTKSDFIDITTPLSISLQLKLRAEIDMKDNSRSRAVIELNGKDINDNPRTYLGVYYVGKDESLYADLSGIGGGKAIISGINLNKILRTLIDEKIPEIPSIMQLLGKGSADGAATAETTGSALIDAVQKTMDDGQLVVTHYGFAAAEEDNSAAPEETASLDIMALLSCVVINMGDSTPLTVESITADLTKDVIAGLLGQLGLKLPVDKLSLKIFQTREDYEAGEEGWKIEVSLNMANEQRGQIGDAEVGLFLNYGNPDPNLGKYLADKKLSANNGYVDVDLLHKNEDGQFDNIWVSLGLELRVRMGLAEGSVIDLSPLAKMLYGLVLKIQSPDGIDADLAIKINANVNVMTLVNAIKNGGGADVILGAINARIDIGDWTDNPEDFRSSLILCLQDGVLYLNGENAELRNYKINLTDALNGNFKLFGKDTSSEASALAAEGEAPTETPEEKGELDVLGLLVANLAGITVSNERLEVLIADTLVSALFKELGVEGFDGDLAFRNEGTSIALEYDGLNLSKLWLEANVGLQQGETTDFDLGLGLGHIVIDLGRKDYAAELKDASSYQDLLNGGNVILGLGAEIDFAMSENSFTLEDKMGALIADFVLATKVEVLDDIKSGLSLNILADVDISSSPATNDSKILIEVLRADKSVLLGIYYDQTKQKLYLDTEGGTIIRRVALDFDLISLIAGLVGGDGSAAADIDLSALNPLIILGSNGIQISLLTGITELLLNVLVGDMTDFIDYNVDSSGTSYKYYPDNIDLDYAIFAQAEKDGNGNVLYYQRAVRKYVLNNEGEFVETDKDVNDVYVKAKEIGYILNSDIESGKSEKFLERYADGTVKKYVLKDDKYVETKEDIAPYYVKETDFFYILRSDIEGKNLENFFEKDEEGNVQEYVNSGRNFIAINKDNAQAYASAPKFIKMGYKPAALLRGDMDLDHMEFEKGFVSPYSESGFPKYVKVKATNQEVALYEVFTSETRSRHKTVLNDAGDVIYEKDVTLNLPELGAAVTIGKFKNGVISVVNPDDEFAGIGIGLFVMKKGATEPWTETFVEIVGEESYTGDKYRKEGDSFVLDNENGTYKRVIDSSNTALNLAVKLGNIQLSEKKFVKDHGMTLAEYIAGVDAKGLPVADAKNIENLIVHLNVEAAIELGAEKTPEEGTAWNVGNILSAALGSNTETSALSSFIKNLLIRFKVTESFHNVVGLRIAGNVNIGALLGAGETMDKVAALLENSDIAVELTDGYPWLETSKRVVALYVTGGMLYANIDGSLIENTKFKIEISKIMGIVKGVVASDANAEADLDLEGILGLITGIVKEISIYNNETEAGVTIGLGKNTLGALLGVIAGIEGVDLELNEANSKIEINTKITEDKPYIIKVNLGIDPVEMGVSLGGLRIGLAREDYVIPAGITEDAGYKDINSFSENVSLDVEIGIDIGLKQGEIELGKIVSTIMQALGYDVEFPLNLDVQDNLNLDLRIRIAGNINLQDVNKSDIMIQIRNDARPDGEKTIFGLYLSPDENGKPCLYVEARTYSATETTRIKVENFDLLGSLLGKTLEGVLETLGAKLEAEGTALAAGEGETTREILLDVASDGLKISVAKELVNGLLAALLGDKVDEDIVKIIEELGLSAEIGVSTDKANPLLSVKADCSYFNLGVLINDITLSLDKLTDIFDGMDFAVYKTASELEKSALGVKLGLRIDYDLSDGKHNLDNIIRNVATADVFSKDATMTTVGNLLKALTLDAVIKNTHGYIGIEVAINVLTDKMGEVLPKAGQALADLILGKIDESYEVSGQSFDALEILNMIEASVVLDINKCPVTITLSGGYVYVALNSVGGDNFRISLAKLIDTVKADAISASTALVAEGEEKTTDFVLVNTILQNLLASASIGDAGLDLALAPSFMSVLLESVVAKALGETFAFDENVLAQFTLSSPYAVRGTEGAVSVDERIYVAREELRYTAYNAQFASQQGRETYISVEIEGVKEFRKLYAFDGTTYVVYTGGEVEKLYYYVNEGDPTPVECSADETASQKYVLYNYTSYVSVYDSADVATRNAVTESTFTNGMKLYYANGEEASYDKVYVKVRHSGIGWTKENGITLDFIFDDPATEKANDFSMSAGIDASIAFSGSAINVFPAGLGESDYGEIQDNADQKVYLSLVLSLEFTGAESTNRNLLEFVGDIVDILAKGQYVEIAAEEVYTGTRYSFDEATGSYVEDVNGTFKFVPPSVTGDDIRGLNTIGGLLVSIGEFENKVDIRVSLGANIAKLVEAFSAEKTDIVSLIKGVELAIESLDAEGNVKGGIYLYNSNIYIKYINSERGIFAMPVSELLSAIGGGSAADDVVVRPATDPAMLQLWVGEYLKLNGEYTTGFAATITSGLVSTLLETLLGLTPGSLDLSLLSGVDAQITAVMADPVYTGADHTHYVKIVETGEYQDIETADITKAEGYDPAYPEALATRYVKDDEGNYSELTFNFNLNAFSIGVGLKIGHLNLNLDIGHIEIGLAGDTGTGVRDVVPADVKAYTVPDETAIDLSLNVEIGISLPDDKDGADKVFDLGKFIDGLGLLAPTTLGDGWLNITVPDGGAELILTLGVALSLNITDIDHSVAEISIKGKIIDDTGISERTLIGVYFKDGEVLIDLSGLGFDNIKVSGLRLSSLLGASNGIDIIKNLTSKDTATGSALYAGAQSLDFVVAGNPAYGVPAAALILDGDRLAVEVSAKLIEGILNIAGLGLAENVKNIIAALDINALVEVNYAPEYKLIESEDFTGTKYRKEGNDYIVDNENGTYERIPDVSVNLKAEVAELLGISVSVNNIKIGNTGVVERVNALNADEYAEFIELIVGEKDGERGILGFEPKLEALTISLDLDVGSMFYDGMFMGKVLADGTNVSSVGSIGAGALGLRASINIEIAFAELLNKLEQGFDTADIYTAIETVLPLVKAQISFYAQSDGDELIGVYVADGNIYLMLDGLGMPNVCVPGSFLMDIVEKAMAGSAGSALVAETGTGEEGTGTATNETLEKVLEIMRAIVGGIEAGNKSLRVALVNGYFSDLLDYILFGTFDGYYNKVMPDLGEPLFSGITINLGDLTDEFVEIGDEEEYHGIRYYLDETTGHYVIYSRNEYPNPENLPTKFYKNVRRGLVAIDLDAYATHVNVSLFLPKLGAKANLITSPNVQGTEFAYADEINGLSLGLKGQLKIDKQEGVALANILKGVVGDLETKLVIKDDIDIRFAIEASVGFLFSVEDMSFEIGNIDLKISLSRYDAATDSVSPLAIITYSSDEGTAYIDVSHFFKKQDLDGSKKLGLLKVTGVNIIDLINGLISGDATSALAAAGDSGIWADEAHTYFYYEANATNAAAPVRYANVTKVDETGNAITHYVNYTGGISDYKTTDGNTLYVRDRSNAITGYSVYSAANESAFRYKAKYTLETEYEYELLSKLFVKDGENYVQCVDTGDYSKTELYAKLTAEDGAESYVKVSDGSKSYVRIYNAETCKYDYPEYDAGNPDHNAPVLYTRGEDGTFAEDAAAVIGAGAYVKVPVYSVSAVWADLTNYGKPDNVAGYDVASNAKVNITGKAMLGLIGGLLKNEQIENILDTLLISIHATKDPFIFGADIGILDAYNDHKVAFNLGLNIFGFDFEKGAEVGETDGSYLEFAYKALKPVNADDFRLLADIDLNRILNAAEVMDVLMDSINVGDNGKLYLNLSLDLNGYAQNTGDNVVYWEQYLASLLGIDANSARVLYQVLYSSDDKQAGGVYVDVAAAIDVKNLIGGILAGTGLNLEGTEFRITISTDAPVLAQNLSSAKIVITAIGEANNRLTVYIDNSQYRGKSKHKLTIDLGALMGDATALASADVDTGLMPENIFNIVNAILGEVRLGDGKLTVSLRQDFVGELLNVLLGTSIQDEKSLLNGEVYIDLRNLEVQLKLSLGDNNLGTENADQFSMAILLGGLNVGVPEGYNTSENTFIPAAERDEFKDLRQLKLDINFDAEFYYKGTEDSEGLNFNPVIDLVQSLLKKKIFGDKQFQMLIMDETIDACYTISINAHLDFADFNNMYAAIEIYRTTEAEPTPELRIGVYLDGKDIYIDLSNIGLPKLSVTGVNLGDILNDAIGGLFDTICGTGEGAQGALAAGFIEDYDARDTNVANFFRSSWGKVLFPEAYEQDNNGDYVLVDGNYVKYNPDDASHQTLPRYREITGGKPYLSFAVADNRFGFGISSAFINNLLETIANAINLDIQLPEFGDAILLLDSRKDLTGDGYEDTQLEIAVQVNKNFYFGFRTNGLEITGNRDSSNKAKAKFTEKVGNGAGYTSVYDVAEGEIGLSRVALGFDLDIAQTCVDNGASDFEKYLGTLLKSLLGINNFKLNLPSSGTLGYTVNLRASLDIGKLISALNGTPSDWWKDVELYLNVAPHDYGSLIRMYKLSGDNDVYADLTGLSLFKVKIIGLEGLIGGLVSGGSASALVAETKAEAAASGTDIAKLTVYLGQTGIRVDIGWGVVEGILTGLLGETLKVADGTGDLAGYKTITFGEGETATTIPLPTLNTEKALSLGITYGSVTRNVPIEISIGIGFNKNDASAIKISMKNIKIAVGETDCSNYIRYGLKNNQIATSGTNVMADVSGENAYAFSGLVLNDAKGISLINILTAVIKGIDPDITIDWYKNTQHYYNVDNKEGNAERHTTIQLSRTTSSTEHMTGGDKTYAGKFQVHINNDKNREIGVWLFNNQLYIDISETLDIPLSIGALRKMKIMDIDILGMLGGLGSAAEETALVAEEASEETSIKDTIGKLISGIEVNWWNNNSVEGYAKGDKNFSTIRVDLNADGLNEMLASLYYMLYGLYDTTAPAADTLPKDVLQNHVYLDRGTSFTYNGVTYSAYGAHNWCVYYLQTFAAKFIGESAASILNGMLKPGGTLGNVLREILGGLLPLPKLDSTKANYAEIVLDKSRIASGKGVIKEIALSINKERTSLSGNTYSRISCGANTAEIIIKLDNGVKLRAVKAVKNYDNGLEIPKSSNATIVVEDPFNPVELTSASLNSAGLLDRVDATFYGISEYTSKKQNGVNDDYAILGGTPVVWDTSTARLAPGEESVIWGYALNYPVQSVKVKVSSMTEFLRMFGYFKADGTTFVESNKVTVNPTVDPTKATDGIVADLPSIIVIMRKDGELQVLSKDYDSSLNQTVVINGVEYKVDGKFGWIQPDEEEVVNGGIVNVDFWYQVGYSSRIQKSINVKYENTKVVSGMLPDDEIFGILNGGTAIDFTSANMDIVGNIGLGSIKASSTFTDKVTYLEYAADDGSTYRFVRGTAPTEEEALAEWNSHRLGLNGSFTRLFDGNVLQTGTYEYVKSDSVASGLLDSLGGLFGGENATADSGTYKLTVADSGYKWLDRISVLLANGKTTEVDVLEWNFDDLDYDMNKPEKGVKGTIVAVINKYGIERNAATLKDELVNNKQEIKIKVSVKMMDVDGLASGNVRFNQYDDMFVQSESGDYVLATKTVFVAYDENNAAHASLEQYALIDGEYKSVNTEGLEIPADNTARYVLDNVTGYVYDKSATGEKYNINFFDSDMIFVRIKHSRLSFETYEMDKDTFRYYTNVFTTETGEEVNMFVVPELGVKTERNITVTAGLDINDAYGQTFEFKISVTPKTAERIILLTGLNEVIDLETAKVTICYKDGTTREGIAKDLIANAVIPENATARTGIVYGTASIVKAGDAEGLFTQNRITLEIRVF